MRGIRRRLPSPAMVVALIALFSSLGGVSYGLAKGAINGREVKNRSLTGKDLRDDSVGGRVVKESDLGTVPSAGIRVPVRRRHALRRGERRGRAAGAARACSPRSSSGEDGDYQVVFDKEITNCAYMATIVSETAVASALRGQIGVGLAASRPPRPGGADHQRAGPAGQAAVPRRGLLLSLAAG